MIEMLSSTGNLPAFIACLVGLGVGMALMLFGLVVKCFR